MIVSDEAFEYLKWQAGDLYDISHNRRAWDYGLSLKLYNQYLTIADHLPKPCRSVLDVGSGLGASSAYIWKQRGGIGITLLDGDNCQPVTERHNLPHNSMDAARRFMADNGIGHVTTITPDILVPSEFDLVISFAAWCFHFEPDTYLDWVAESCTKETVIILDVRRDRPEWDAQLASRFRQMAITSECAKSQRKVFRLAA